jgi:hypothetical protein
MRIMWFSGIKETNWKPFEAFSFFLEKRQLRGFLWGFPGDGGTGDSRWELPRLPLALNHVDSKWACAIPARVLARKDPSTEESVSS